MKEDVEKHGPELSALAAEIKNFPAEDIESIIGPHIALVRIHCLISVEEHVHTPMYYRFRVRVHCERSLLSTDAAMMKKIESKLEVLGEREVEVLKVLTLKNKCSKMLMCISSLPFIVLSLFF